MKVKTFENTNFCSSKFKNQNYRSQNSTPRKITKNDLYGYRKLGRLEQSQKICAGIQPGIPAIQRAFGSQPGAPVY